ncbi:MAG: hypothetical protein ACOYJW_07265 [Candidatus Omnitrophota bacterium]
MARYNTDFPHQSLNNMTPEQFFKEQQKQPAPALTNFPLIKGEHYSYLYISINFS